MAELSISDLMDYRLRFINELFEIYAKSTSEKRDLTSDEFNRIKHLNDICAATALIITQIEEEETAWKIDALGQ